MSEKAAPPIPQAEALAVGVPPPDGVLTQQQIEARHALVGLHRETKETSYPSGFSFVEELSSLPADEARALLEKERAWSEQTGTVTYRLAEYNAYVSDLREVRAGQREHITQALQRVPTDAPPNVRQAAYIEALDYSPPLASRALTKINQIADNGDSFMNQIGRKLFTDEQITELAEDKTKFQQALNQLMIKEPAIVLRAGSLLSKVAEPQQIHSALKTLQETDPDLLWGHIDFALKYYTPEDGKQLIREISEANPSTMLYKVLKSNLFELVGEDTVRSIAIKAVKEGSYLPDQDSLATCIKKGYISLEDVKTRVLADIEADPNNDNTGRLLNGELLSLEDRLAIHDAVLTRYQTADDDLFRQVSTCTILTFEERQGLIQSHFDANPMAVIDQFGSTLSIYIQPEELRTQLVAWIGKGSEDVFASPSGILTNTALTPEDKRAYVTALIKEDPGNLLGCVQYIDGTYGDALYDEQQLNQVVKQAVDGADFSGVSIYLNKVVGCLGTPEEQKQYIQQRFSENPNMHLFSSYNIETVNNLFTHEEQLAMLREVVMQAIDVDNPSAYISSSDFQDIRKAFGDNVLKDVSEQIRQARPVAFLSAIDEFAYVYEPEELTKIINDLASTTDDRDAGPARHELSFGDWRREHR